MVSVIIDNYNYEKYIHEAIESIIFQTYADWELIVVDDGSRDGSFEVMERYALRYPDRIRLIRKENGGQASCFNAGFETSRGEIIAFLDSDDFWFPNKLERIVETHKEHGFVAHEKPFFMDFQTFKRAVDSMEGYEGIRSLMGGEPTLHPEYERFISYLGAKFPERFPEEKGEINPLTWPQKEFIKAIQRVEYDNYEFLDGGERL